MRVTIKIKKKGEQPLILAKLVCFQGERERKGGGERNSTTTQPPQNAFHMPSH
jgi:hypothetical protein